MKQYVIGVDGGASKTHYALFDDEANLVNFVAGGPTNHEHFKDGYNETFRILDSTIREQLLKPVGLTPGHVSYGVFGLAGVDVPRQQEALTDLIAKIGIQNIKVVNDAFPGIKAGSPNGYGICSINGSGTCCAAIDPKGRTLQIGGTGEIFGDYAGAGYIGSRLIKYVYDSYFRCGKKTGLAGKLLDLLEINNPEQIVEAAYERIFPSKLYDESLKPRINVHDLAKFVFIAANEGDEVALDILEHCGRETGKAVAGAIKWLDFSSEEAINVVLAGSVYVKGENPALINALKQEVQAQTGKSIIFTLLSVPPVAGAVIWAFEEIRGRFDPGLQIKVNQCLKKHLQFNK